MNTAETKFFELVEQGFFEIDEEGHIWRIARYFRNPYVTREIRPVTPRRADRKSSGNPYLIVDFTVEGEKFVAYAHRLVWIWFFGDIPEGLEINHKQGNKTDNRPGELELVTPGGNLQHAWEMGLMTGNTRLTDPQVLEIRQRYIPGVITYRELGEEYGVTGSQIGNIINNQRRTRLQPTPVEIPELSDARNVEAV